MKDALRAGIACGTEEVPIKINLIAPPLYVVTTSTPEKSVRKADSRVKHPGVVNGSSLCKLAICDTLNSALQEGLKLVTEACEAIDKKIKEVGGSFSIQMAPKVVTATDEADLAKQLERAEMENAEVSGDDDDEEQVGMGGKISDEEGDDKEDEEGEGGDKAKNGEKSEGED